MAVLRCMMQTKGIPAYSGKGVAVLNYKPTRVLRLSMSNLVASHRPGTQSLHQKLAAVRAEEREDLP